MYNLGDSWLHQVIEDGDAGVVNAEQPPSVDSDAMINDSDHNAMHAYTNFTCAEFGPSSQPRLGS